MKKIIFSLFASCVLFLVSCGGAAGVAVDSVIYMEQLKSGEFEKFTSNFSPALSSEDAADYAEFLADSFEELGYVKDYEVKECVISEDGKEAAATFTITYGNGSAADLTMGLVLVGSDWKMVPPAM
ncbi:MAG: hypothetical protein R3Y51_06160 [Rikenellaceae bacterium]